MLDLAGIALHEAGHALVACYFGLEVWGCEIRQAGDQVSGATRFYNPLVSSSSGLAAIEIVAAMALAGDCAEHASGYPLRRPSEADAFLLDDALGRLRALGLGHLRLTVIAAAVRRSKLLIGSASGQHFLGRTAQLLLERGHLDGSACRAVFASGALAGRRSFPNGSKYGLRATGCWPKGACRPGRAARSRQNTRL